MTLIERLASLRGIGEAYHDYRGELRHFDIDSKIGILQAMGCNTTDTTALADEVSRAETVRFRKFLPPLAAAHGGNLSIEINISARQFGSSLLWSVLQEDGARRDGATSTADCPELWRGEVEGSWITRRRFELPFELPPGYHELEMHVAGCPAERCALVISPPQCYEPSRILEGGRLWGMAVQLYTLRSKENWGIGDFDDLKAMIRWAAPLGAGFIGLNPLHALAPSDPERCSPYSASSRHFLNVLYISVPAVAEYPSCAAASKRCEDAAFTARLAQLRERPYVDYAAVAELKFEVLELLYRDFSQRHLAQDSERARVFRSFVAGGGALLQTHALFDALDRFFRAKLGTASGWMNWPLEFQDVHGEAARTFAVEHPEEVRFYAYLQWLAHEQLCSAQELTRQMGMPVGIYGDYAVGANPSGSETWADRRSYCMGAEIGAPPDPLALRGQGWGIPPQDPSVMQAQCLQGFVRLIRNNMRYYGALRLDHVMSLARLWWVPGGASPTKGAYVHYPLNELLTVVSLESDRNACLVVGEDLGVVPDEMRRAMPEFGLYHYKVLLFEQIDNRFRRPEEFVSRALATVTTHDMPTLRSYWDGNDIELRRRLLLYPSPEIEADVMRERARDKELLLTALREQNLAPASPATPFEPFTADLAQAMHLYLARSTTTLVALQIEDLLCMVDPVNVPGTDREYPNWQRKLSQNIEDIAARQDLAAALAAIDRTRGARVG
jgi:4-alpha-glucanotransferase